MAAQLSITVLGPMTIDVDGAPVRLGGPQQRAVLAALTVAAGRAVPRDVLIDRLWPDDVPASGPKLVQKHISALRASLGDASIETVGVGYRLVVDPSRIDAVAVERTWATIESCSGDEARIAALRDAERRWHGDPYTGCGDLPFLVDERTRLRSLRQQMITARLALELGLDATTVVPELEALTAEHPEDERLAGLLMRGLYRAGRAVDALRAYRRIDSHLREVLGVMPSPELAELEAQVLQHDESLRARRSLPADPSGLGNGTVAVATGAAELAGARAHDEPGDDEPGDDEPGDDEEIRSVVVVAVDDPPTSHDPEDVRAAHELLLADVRRVATTVDATCAPTGGGVVLLGLGLPAHDDDPQRAVMAAQAIIAVRDTARVAVGAGPAVVSRTAAHRYVAGAVLDRTVRMLDGCAAGTYVVDADLAPRLDETRGPDTDLFVGREAEVSSVAHLWRRTAGDGRLRVLEVIGEAGMGKTRLVREVTQVLEPAPVGLPEVSFTASDRRGLAGALGPVVASLARRHGDVDSLLDAAGVDRGDRDWLRRHLVALVEPPSDDHTRPTSSELLAAWAQLVAILSSRGPVLVVVEDLHWAAPSIGAELASVVERLRASPVVVVICRRPEPAVDEVELTWATERLTMRLTPLATDDLRRLSVELGPGLSPEVVGMAAERSGGNPLFLQQYVRMLRDRPGADATREAPDDIRRLIASRLDLLPAEARQLLQAAAVLGRRFPAAHLGPLVGHGPDPPSGIGPLLRSGLLRRVHHPDAERYEFHHDLVTEVAYGQLVRARRIELHRRAAHALTSSSALGLEDLHRLVRHWRQVIELSSGAAVQLDDADVGTAFHDLVTAADRFGHIDAQAAIDAYSLALGLSAEPTAPRGEVLLKLGQIGTHAGEFAQARAALATAREIFGALGDRARAAEAGAREARTFWYTGEGDRIDALLDTAIDRIAGITDSGAAAHVLTVAASQRALRGEPDAALELAERAVVVSGEAHMALEDRIRLLHVTGHARFDLDDPSGADDLRRALELTVEHEHSRLASQSYNNLAEVLWVSKGPDEAIDLACAGLELSLQRGLLGQAPWHVAQLCELRYDLGSWDEVEHPPEAPSTATPLATLTLRQLAARVRFWRGDDDQLDLLAAQVAVARAAKDRQSLLPPLCALIAVTATTGDLDGARVLGGELLEVAGEAGYHRLREAGDAVRGLVRAGEPATARAFVPVREPVVLRRRLQWRSATALLIEVTGDATAALERFAEAEAGWDTFPHPYEAGHAAAGVARCARALGDEQTAERAARRARQRFAALGAARLLASSEHDVT
ncbi:MAG: BTAD domain-containing putative transcriptional regulator [Actinomycetota bacterium]|nr:BTAD domain-containing putative transcriptional regulator [Actinomycetota bacterium]